jgi:PST family polysaccharide transporter
MTTTEPHHVVLEEATQGHRSTLRSQALRILCKLISVLILARWVTPEEHGLYAMASSFVLLLALFRDAGLGTAAMQARTLDEPQLNTLFWTHLGLGGLLSLVTVIAAPSIANFYRTPAVTPLLFAMSVAFIFIGAGGFARSQLARTGRFIELNWVENVSAVTATVAMIGAALVGAGAYAFATYLLISEAVATLLAWRAFRWGPTARPRWRSLRPLLSMGGDITLYQTVAFALQQLDIIAVGRYFGAHAAGFYNRGNQLLAMPGIYVVAPLNQIALVTLSRLGRDSQRFSEHARTTATTIAHFTLPLFAICVVMPLETVRLVLGPQWPDAAPLLRLLAIAAAASTIISLAYAMNVATGQTRRLAIAAAGALPLTACAIWIGLAHGVLGVATAIATVNVALIVPRAWWSLRDVPGALAAFAKGLVGPLMATATGATCMILVGSMLSGVDWRARLAIAGGAGICAELVLAATWPRLRAEWRLAADFLPLPRSLRLQTDKSA